MNGCSGRLLRLINSGMLSKCCHLTVVAIRTAPTSYFHVQENILYPRLQEKCKFMLMKLPWRMKESRPARSHAPASLYSIVIYPVLTILSSFSSFNFILIPCEEF